MIPKNNRFHGLGSLNPVYKKGFSERQDVFGLKALPTNKPDYRLAVVVSKKVHKSAVVRNRIRRRVYEVVRNARKNDGKPWQYDIIITCFDERAAEQPSEKLKQNIEKLLAKAKITTTS